MTSLNQPKRFQRGDRVLWRAFYNDEDVAPKPGVITRTSRIGSGYDYCIRLDEDVLAGFRPIAVFEGELRPEEGS